MTESQEGKATQPPPYPAETRAKGWRFELDYEQIEQSDTWSLAAEIPMCQHALLMMWMVAWAQTPCGSFPNDESVIRAKCKVPPAVWSKCRDALMRGWWLAEDGRMYHPTITTLVFEMMGRRRKESDRKALARARTDHVVPPLSHGTDAGLPPDSTRNPAPTTDHLLPLSSPTGQKDKPARKRAASPVGLPEWVPAKEWGEFIAHRKAMRGVPFTDAAQSGVLRELSKFRDLGHDPSALLTTAIVRGWRTVFEPKPSERAAASGSPINRQEAIEKRNRAVGDEWLRQQEAIDANH